VIVLMPGATPDATPVPVTIDTADGVPLLHVPPDTPALNPNVVEFVPQIVNVPEITGVALSVTIWVAVQPAPVVV